MMRVAVFTGSRADYGLLRPLLRLLRVDDRFELRLIVTGAHLDEAHGMTVREIEAEGMPISARVPLPLDDDSLSGVARAMGAAVGGVADALEEWTPDVLVVLGDRYEAFAAAAAATVLRVPIAHIHGGELTYGAIDDAFRHSITKMADLHFTATREYRRRVIQMGADPSTVHDVGALAADNALAAPDLSPDEFEERYHVRCDRDTLLVTFHPASAGGDSADHLRALLEALDRLADFHVLFTGSNADAEGSVLTAMVRDYVAAHGDRAAFVVSLGHDGYMAAVRNAAAVVGNSSSGIIEVPILGVPSVDIGDRQAGRLRPASVIHVEPTAGAIIPAVLQATSEEFRSLAAGSGNPYGDGHTAERIVKVLADSGGLAAARTASFFDIDFGDDGL